MLKDYSEIQEAAHLFDELIKLKQDTLVSGELDRDAQLENVLTDMCGLSGFSSAVLSDADGFPMVAHNSPVENDEMAACTTVLAGALEKAASLLGRDHADLISVDITSTEKASLRRFLVNDTTFFLMIICPQEVDERSEINLAIEQITSILGQT
jgi:predicted regulator of Ras-like GTPase activity (Roadblock/LC7/MglB family)